MGILGLIDSWLNSNDEDEDNENEAGEIITEEEDPIPDNLPDPIPGTGDIEGPE